MRMLDPCPHVFSELSLVASGTIYTMEICNLLPTSHPPPLKKTLLPPITPPSLHTLMRSNRGFCWLFFKWQSREHCPGDMKRSLALHFMGSECKGTGDCRKGGAWWRRRSQMKSGALMRNSSILELCAQIPRESCQSLVKLGLEFKWESGKLH